MGRIMKDNTTKRWKLGQPTSKKYHVSYLEYIISIATLTIFESGDSLDYIINMD